MNAPFSSTAGGIERTTVNLAKYLSLRDDIKCYCLFNQFLDQFQHIEKIQGSINNPLELRKIIINHKIDIILFPAGPWYTLVGNQAVYDTTCKIITAYHSKPGYETLVLKKRLKRFFVQEKKYVKKIYYLINLTFFPIYKAINKRKTQKLFQKGYDYSDKFVLLSERFIEDFKSYYSLPNKEKLVGIGNALSFDYFATKQDIQAKRKVILVVSRLDEASKRISMLIKIWKQLQEKYSDWSLKIVGDGPDKKMYESLIETQGLKNVMLLGKQKPLSFYKEASIFLMSSSIEGWGMTLTESLQTGCVPIAFNTFSSIKDIIEDTKTGFIIPEGDIELFKNKVTYLIDNIEQREQMAMAGVQSSYQFEMDKVGKQWITIFKELVQQ